MYKDLNIEADHALFKDSGRGKKQPKATVQDGKWSVRFIKRKVGHYLIILMHFN